MTSAIFWYLALLLCGAIYTPFVLFVFPRFRDGGYPFAKTIGLFAGGILTWAVCVFFHAPFTSAVCVVCLLVPAAAGAFLFFRARARKTLRLSVSWKLNAVQELLFLLLLLFFIYLYGFKPEAYGTEKLMDYAFLTSMIRSVKMPPADPWYAGSAINYYYGGQYLTAYLVRLSGVTAGEGYTFMRAFITAGSFTLPFSLVRNMLHDRILFSRKNVSAGNGTALPASADDGTKADAVSTDGEYIPGRITARRAKAAKERKTAALFSSLGGALAGLAVAFCGNAHYIVYGILIPLIQKLKGQAPDFFWFPDSTRYIGYNPDTADKTIHEFPAYSSILGDLHAHYINLLFVITVTAVAYAFAQRLFEKPGRTVRVPDNASVPAKILAFARDVFIPEVLLAPEIWLIGWMTGVFRFTNFWDFPIYFVVCGSLIFFTDLKRYRASWKTFAAVLISQAVFAFLVGTAAALPFTLHFDQISTEVAFVHSHTALYQLMILWGLPAAVSLAFLAENIWTARKARLRFLDFFTERPLPDLAALLLSWCAMGLVLMPEVIYVRDIYEGGHYRANTMFKLTYQSFILFGIVMGYVLARAFCFHMRGREAARRSADPARRILFPARLTAAVLATVLLLTTGGYFINGCRAWFGTSLSPDRRVHSDASVFISQSFPEDFGGVSFLNEKVAGQPVILEANGDSYTGYARISAATGLPTVLGWYVHEWLWRSDTDAENVRASDIEAIYTGDNADHTLRLLRKYNVRYVYIGKLEREKFPDIKEDVLRRTGDVVYEDEHTIIIRIP